MHISIYRKLVTSEANVVAYEGYSRRFSASVSGWWSGVVVSVLASE